MKMSSEGGDTRFPDNLRVPAKVVTGWGHKKKGVETLGRVAVKINGKGQKLWVFPAAIHSGEPPPSPDARDGEVAPAGEVARAPKRQRRQPAAAAGAANDVVELQAKVTLGGQAVEASMALTPSALGFAEVEEVDCQFFRFLGTMLARAAQQRAWSRRQQQHGAEVTGQRVTREPGLGSPRARAGRAARKSRRASI